MYNNIEKIDFAPIQLNFDLPNILSGNAVKSWAYEAKFRLHSTLMTSFDLRKIYIKLNKKNVKISIR